MAEISKEELRKLRKARDKLHALESAGVDNWDGYDDALTELRKLEEREDRINTLVVEICEELCSEVEEPAGRGCGFGFRNTEGIFSILDKAVKEFTLA